MFSRILSDRPIAAQGKTSSSSSNNTVRNPDFRILEVLCGLAGKFGKTYSFPSQEKLLELVKRFTGREMSRRTLNRHLRALEEGHWLRRRRRHVYDKKRGFVFRSTLYAPMWRYCQRLQRNAKAIFSILGAQTKSAPSFRVSLMAQNMNLFFKKVIQSSP
jgi:hypothetical protein